MKPSRTSNVTMEERENDVSTSSRTLSRYRTPTTNDALRHELSSPLRNRRPISSFLLIILLTISCSMSLASASNVYIDEQMIEGYVDNASEGLGSTLARLAKSGTILVDTSPPPDPKSWTLATEKDIHLRDLEESSSSEERREEENSMDTTTGTPTEKSTIVAARTGSSISLPSPFDQGFSANITDTCQDFMSGMLTNSTFKSCLPFSLLLQNSNSFFQDSKSLVTISQVLDATCAANLDTCKPLMQSFASNITSSSACATDLSSENPLIESARIGLLAYTTLYTASCLRDPTTSAYCFANAVTNASSPTDSYIYYMPLNISLPGGSQPTCDSCLKDTMAVYESASSDRSSAIASVYESAATQVNINCGPNFVNASLADAVVASGGRSEGVNTGVGMLALVLLVGSWLL